MGDWTYKITEKYDALYSSFILKTANLSYSHWLSWSFACEAKAVYREVGEKKQPCLILTSRSLFTKLYS